jgi:hypothetical protein
MGGEQHRQCEGAGHLDVLRKQEQLLPVQTVGKDAADKGEKDDWQLPKEEIEAEVERILGKIVHEPALRELLHKGADGGHTSAQPHDPEIPISKRSEDTI